MKKLVLLLVILFSFELVKADNSPAITIEYKYKNVSDTTVYFKTLKSDNDFCCNFLITATPSDSTGNNVTLLRHTKTGVILGTFYGKPSKEFILEICNKMGYLDAERVDVIAEGLVKMKNK